MTTFVKSRCNDAGETENPIGSQPAVAPTEESVEIPGIAPNQTQPTYPEPEPEPAPIPSTSTTNSTGASESHPRADKRSSDTDSSDSNISSYSLLRADGDIQLTHLRSGTSQREAGTRDSTDTAATSTEPSSQPPDPPTVNGISKAQLVRSGGSIRTLHSHRPEYRLDTLLGVPPGRASGSAASSSSGRSSSQHLDTPDVNFGSDAALVETLSHSSAENNVDASLQPAPEPQSPQMNASSAAEGGAVPDVALAIGPPANQPPREHHPPAFKLIFDFPSSAYHADKDLVVRASLAQ